jgi:DNA-binding NarL/FixJ family response regulator
MTLESQEATLRPLPMDPCVWTGVKAALELSPQQARIVELLLRGMRDKQIAVAMELRVPTIRTYLNRIFKRLGVQDRLELVVRVFVTAQELRGAGHCHQS